MLIIKRMALTFPKFVKDYDITEKIHLFLLNYQTRLIKWFFYSIRLSVFLLNVQSSWFSTTFLFYLSSSFDATKIKAPFQNFHKKTARAYPFKSLLSNMPAFIAVMDNIFFQSLQVGICLDTIIIKPKKA